MSIKSRPASKEYLDNWDSIFSKKKTKVKKLKEEDKVSKEEPEDTNTES